MYAWAKLGYRENPQTPTRPEWGFIEVFPAIAEVQPGTACFATEPAWILDRRAQKISYPVVDSQGGGVGVISSFKGTVTAAPGADPVLLVLLTLEMRSNELQREGQHMM